jgi:hypothetical protein
MRRGIKAGRGAFGASLLALAIGGASCRTHDGERPPFVLANPPYLQPLRLERGPQGTPVSLLVRVVNSGQALIDVADDGVYFCFETDPGSCPTAGYRVPVSAATVNTWSTTTLGVGEDRWLDVCDEQLWTYLSGKSEVHVRIQVLRSDRRWSFSPPETDPAKPPYFGKVPVVPPSFPRPVCAPRDLRIRRPELIDDPELRPPGEERPALPPSPEPPVDGPRPISPPLVAPRPAPGGEMR